MSELHYYLMQRISAAVMAPLVFVHLGVMIYAIQGGLSADEILSRTQGNWPWGIFYLCFVIAASVHASIGVRKIIQEWFSVSRRLADKIAGLMLAILIIIGLRAVYAVVVGS
ncbi:MAG: fumarate reductase subunit C [Gammaproteobacteria bacterium]|jgi:fumarate reductase subunit C